MVARGTGAADGRAAGPSARRRDSSPPAPRAFREQRWGLGVLGDDVELKGGWGPNPDGRRLVRQMGLVGSLAVALAALPADGSFESGTAMLDRLAQWLGESRATRRAVDSRAAWPKSNTISAAPRTSGSSGSEP